VIFRQHQQALDGTKTQTRRPVKWYPKHRLGNRGSGWYEEYLAANDLGPDYDGFKGDGVYILEWDYPQDTWLGPEDYDEWIRQAKWLIDKTYAVQLPGKKSVGRIRITKIRRERLGDISEDDCWAEGIPLGQTFDDVQGIPFDCYDCPICHKRYDEHYLEAYACLWNHCYGNGAWEHMKDDDVFVLEFEPCDE